MATGKIEGREAIDEATQVAGHDAVQTKVQERKWSPSKWRV